MLASYFFAAVAAVVALFSEAVVAQKGVCKSPPYNALTCLGNVKEAISACSEVPTQTKTVTITTTTLDIVTKSTTQMAATQNQITVNVTTTENRTETVTEGPITTVTNVQLSTYSEGAAVTTYVPCSILSSAASATPSLAAEETCNAAEALPAFASITANDSLATACSCMGNPVPTYTTTETVNAPAVEATTTAVDGTPKTTTLYAITQVTITETVAPATTVSVSSVTTVAASSTLSLAAPTYTPVFGPKAGCVNVNVGSAEALPAEVTTLPQAVKQCKSICNQEPTCKFLYVQKVFESYDGQDPHFVCEMNTKFFKQRRDLRCGKDENIFGKARGFNARERGVPEAAPAPAEPSAPASSSATSPSEAPAASSAASVSAAEAAGTGDAWSAAGGAGSAPP